jgi:hypothetical protein
LEVSVDSSRYFDSELKNIVQCSVKTQLEFCCSTNVFHVHKREPILRLLNLELQSQHFSRLERLSKYVEDNIFVSKLQQATCGVVIFYRDGVVTHDRRIGS